MITGVLHAITDAAVSRRGKFVTIARWLVVAVVLVLVAPKLADIYDVGVCSLSFVSFLKVLSQYTYSCKTVVY